MLSKFKNRVRRTFLYKLVKEPARYIIIFIRNK